MDSVIHPLNNPALVEHSYSGNQCPSRYYLVRDSRPITKECQDGKKYFSAALGTMFIEKSRNELLISILKN